MDAVALLKADHRQVEEWLSSLESRAAAPKKQQLATNICSALTIHTQIEEEIFYPAFLEATEDRICTTRQWSNTKVRRDSSPSSRNETPEDDYFDARVTCCPK